MVYRVGIAFMRLQGVHNLHLCLLEKMVEESDYPILFVGSTNKPRSHKNPFSYDERLELVERLIAENVALVGLEVRPLPDFSTNEEWVAAVVEAVEAEMPAADYNVTVFDARKNGDDYCEWFSPFGWHFEEMHLQDGINASDLRAKWYCGELELVDQQHFPAKTLDFMREFQKGKPEIFQELVSDWEASQAQKG